MKSSLRSGKNAAPAPAPRNSETAGFQCQPFIRCRRMNRRRSYNDIWIGNVNADRIFFRPLCCCCWVTNANESRSSIYARVSKSLRSAADCACRMQLPALCCIGIAESARDGKTPTFQSKVQSLHRQQTMARAPPASGAAFLADSLKCARLLQVELPNDGDQDS